MKNLERLQVPNYLTWRSTSYQEADPRVDARFSDLKNHLLISKSCGSELFSSVPRLYVSVHTGTHALVLINPKITSVLAVLAL